MINVALAMIVKDDTESDSLRKALESASPHVQGIFLTGTKEPQEEIKKLAKEFNANYSFFPWNDNFADARNFAFSQVPLSFPWILWMDADDVLHGGEHFQRVLEETEKVKADTVFAKYFYHVECNDSVPCRDCGLHGQISNVLIEHLRERLVRNNGKFKWIGRIHETCIGQVAVNQTDNYDFAVIHLTNIDRMVEAIYRNIELLQIQLLDEDGKDPRTVYYLAKALFDLNDEMLYDYVIGLLKQYVSQSGWPEEVAQAYQYLADLHRRKGEHDLSIRALLEAVEKWPQFPVFYLDLSLTYLLKGDWQKSEFWANQAEHIEIPKTTLVLSPKDMALRLLEIKFNVFWQTGRIDEAYDAAVKLQGFMPDPVNDDRVNMSLTAKRDNLLAHCVSKLAVHFEKEGDTKKLQALLQAIPKEIATIPTMVDLRNTFSEPRVWGDKEVAIYCGPGFENWGPYSLEKGLGGSEAAVVYLSRELGKLGYRVTVYADPGEDELIDTDGNVRYLPFYHFNQKDKFNVFVAWRQPGLFDIDLQAKTKLLWLHDIANPADYTEARLARIDKIICLSNWHRRNLGNVSEDKIAIIGNGIPLTEIKSTRNPNGLVYASSYDRGLEHLLDMWPEIIKEVPDAQLKVCYGWEMFDKVVGNNIQQLEWKKQMNAKMDQKGITHLGRIPHADLLQLFASSGIWAYPTHFGETSCQTAMMAQAYGSVPCVVDYAALKETVQFGVKVDGDIYDKETKDAYRGALIDLLKNPEKQEEIRKNMVPEAKKAFGWNLIAERWEALWTTNG